MPLLPTLGGMGGIDDFAKKQTAEKDDPIFSLSGTFERLGSTALDAFDKVAPVWLASELDLNRRQPVAVAPTFQSSSPGNQPTQNLTSNSDPRQQDSFVVRQETLLMIGGGILVVGAIFLLND